MAQVSNDINFYPKYEVYRQPLWKVANIIDAAFTNLSDVQWQQQGMNVQINLRYDSFCKFL